MRLYTVLLYFCKLLYMFRVVTLPIIRSTYNCNYSIWPWSNRLCYLPLRWWSWTSVPTSPPYRKVAETVWPGPDAVITVICAPDDGWSYHPKHVEQFTEILRSNFSTVAEGSRDGLTRARCCNYSYMCSWWWVEVPPETCRAFYRNIAFQLLHRSGR